ncbi:MAG: hypothetical protein PHP50_10125 [Lachnospiraceae bacterium]|nr:hypothetical protein [Lachnospiraceae bacterium]
MFDRFGEFDSAEELNKTAAGLLAEGDTESIKGLAAENGLDPEDAEDYIDGVLPELANTLLAALGKLKVEAEELKLAGVLMDWKDSIVDMCTEDPEMRIAVRGKNKQLAKCMAGLIAFAFENKVRVSDKIVDITQVTHNGKKEAMRKPLYLGVPNRAEAKRIAREYYLG